MKQRFWANMRKLKQRTATTETKPCWGCGTALKDADRTQNNRKDESFSSLSPNIQVWCVKFVSYNANVANNHEDRTPSSLASCDWCLLRRMWWVRHAVCTTLTGQQHSSSFLSATLTRLCLINYIQEERNRWVCTDLLCQTVFKLILRLDVEVTVERKWNTTRTPNADLCGKKK